MIFLPMEENNFHFDEYGKFNGETIAITTPIGVISCQYLEGDSIGHDECQKVGIRLPISHSWSTRVKTLPNSRC